MLTTHFKTHRVKYLSFAVVAVLIALITYTIYKAAAITIPVFQSSVGQAPTPAVGDHLAALNFPETVAIDSQGNMYVGDSSILQKFNSSGTLVSSFVGQFGYVSAVAVDSQDNLYVADSYGETVQKFDSSGNYIMGFGSYGSGNGQFDSPFSIAVTATGTIYVTDYYNNRVQVFDASGNYLTKFGTVGSGDGQLNAPWGIGLDSSNNVYVVEWGNNRVSKFDSAGNFISKWGTSGSGNGQFTHPAGLTLDKDANTLYVSDDGNARIQLFDTSGNYVSKFGTSGSANGQLCAVENMAFDASHNFYVADTCNARIQKFDSNWNYLSKWAAIPGSGDGAFDHPTSVARDADDNIYVMDMGNHRVEKFDSSGNFVTKWGSLGSGDGQFAAVPYGSYNDSIAVDASSSVYVTDIGNNRVQKFDSNGTFMLKWGTAGSGDGQFGNFFGFGASGLAVDANNNVYVTDASNPSPRVQKFDSSGNFLMKFGSGGSGNGQFSFPQGVFVDNLGNIYVADGGNHRVQKFDSSGSFVMKFGSNGTGDGQFSYPRAIYVDSSRNIYIGDSNNRIQKFDSSGSFVYKFGVFNSDNIGFVNPEGITALSDGAFVIADTGNNRVVTWDIPTAPPLVISNIHAASTATTTTITWDTDSPGTSMVEFGPSTNYGSTTPIVDISPMVSSHSVTLLRLARCASYEYRVSSSNGTLSSTSNHRSFTTDSCTGLAATTASSATDASTTATSTMSLSTITVSIPPTFSTTTDATTTFQAVQLEPVAFFASSSVPEGTKSASSEVFHLTALTDATTTLSTFTAPITVTLSYIDNALSGIDPATLKIYRYDDGVWFLLSNCTRDPAAHTVTCETSHFSDFSLFGAPDSSSVTYGGGGFVSSPSSASSGSSATTGTATTTAATTTTIPALKPVVTPVKVIPKPAVPKPAVTSTSRATTTPPLTRSLPRPSATTTPHVFQKLENTPLPSAASKKTIIQKLLEWVGWR